MAMTSSHFASQTRQFGRGHAIVMTFVAGAAVITTSALLATTPADAPLAARVGQTIAGERRAPEAPTLVRTHGYVEFDWSSAGGVVPGFEPLPSTGNSSAGAQ